MDPRTWDCHLSKFKHSSAASCMAWLVSRLQDHTTGIADKDMTLFNLLMSVKYIEELCNSGGADNAL